MRRATFFLAAVLCAALAGAEDWRGPAALEVTVEDVKGRNLVGAEVILVYLSPDGGGQLPSVLTGPGGKATIGGLAAGRWSVEVRSAGHMSFRAELTLSGEGKPVVESAAQQMTPGATSTMKVKFARGRGGAAPLTSAAPVEPARAPAAGIQPLVAPEPEPAPAPARIPADEGAPAVGRVPPPAPAPAIEQAPVKEAPPVKPVVPPAIEKAPVKEESPARPVVAPAPAAAPAPSTSVQPPPAPAKQPTPTVAPLQERAPQQPPMVTAKPSTVAVAPLPERAPQPPPVVQAKPAAAPQAPAKQRLCVECPPGESAAWGEAAIAGGATAGCPADLAARLKAVELANVGRLSVELGPGCRVIAVELPAGARFTGFRYEAQSQGVAADCLPGRGCPAGSCRFPFEPVLRQESKRTTLLVGFESTAADLRRAVVAGYSTYSKK